jgi:glycosyltransferase involved in cell wall biosynthesis
LQVIPALKSGGVEIETLQIAKAIAAAGGRALIAANLDGNDLQGTDQLPSEITFINLPLDTKNPLRIATNTALLKNLIQQENVDIVHARSRAPAWSAYKASRSLGIPFMTTYHAAYHSQTVLKTFYNSVMARGDRVIAISQFIADHLNQRYQERTWFDPEKVRVILRGIDVHYFDPSAVTNERIQHLRHQWEIPSDMRLLLLPGRISKSKGHMTLIQALSLMKETNVMAVFVGSDQGHEIYREQLLHEAAALDLEGRVRWFPPCPDLPAAYGLADFVVCPSLVPEGFGRLMAEAQAMKKPVIASNGGAASEVVDDGKTGWLIPAGDGVTLAQTLDHALRLPRERLETMGNRGRKRAEALFSQEHMNSMTIDVYRELCE